MLTIIDPADGRAFLRASVPELLRALGDWWGATVIPALWWPGLLVVGFGAAVWARCRWPRTAEWKPCPGDRADASRTAPVLGLVGIVCGVLVLVDSRWFLDLLLGGRAVPAAREAFACTEAFRRRLQTALSLATCAVLAWIALDGPVFVAPATDRTAKVAIVVLVALTLGGMALRLYRSVRPSPEGSPGPTL